METKTRRTFLSISLWGIGAFLVFIWNKISLFSSERNHRTTMSFPFNRHKRVTFYKDYIVVHEGNETKVLSAYCSHLGCRINSLEKDKLVCPCHGSEYNLQGEVIKGPAFKRLKQIPSHVTKDEKTIVIGAQHEEEKE